MKENRKKMKKLMGITIITAVTMISVAAMASTNSGTLDVTATVVSTCRVTGTNDVAFGNYDPTDPTDNTAGVGWAKFRCTKNTSYGIYIARNNQMSDGTNNLSYELYSDSGRTSAYAQGSVGTPYSAADNSAITADIYGKIAALQDVPAGSYSETVTFTVEY